PVSTPYFAAAFRERFRMEGGSLKGQVRVDHVPPGTPLIYGYQSEAFLSQVLILMNKYSNNFLADQLVMLMGAQANGFLATKGESAMSKGLSFLRQTLKDADALSDDLIVDRGSGLSLKNRVSAQALVGVLAASYHDPKL